MQSGVEALEFYRIAHEAALRVHKMSFDLPSFERMEEAPQIRRSSKRVTASIVEGFAQRRYKGLYLSYLYRALGSSDETQEHLHYLKETGSLKDGALFELLLSSYTAVSGKLFSFITVVERQYELPRYLQVAPSDDEGIPPPEDGLDPVEGPRLP